MTVPPRDISPVIWKQWLDAVAQGEVAAALGALFDDLQAELARYQPTCRQSGRCCRFETFGHRLYVTGLEIAWLVGRLEATDRSRLDSAVLPERDGCPFQADRRCTVHAIRPLGCRVFFCEASAQGWQPALYEKYLARLRRLHDRHDLPYVYLEWRRGLAQVGRAIDGR